jgi:hypothetical protein
MEIFIQTDKTTMAFLPEIARPEILSTNLKGDVINGCLQLCPMNRTGRKIVDSDIRLIRGRALGFIQFHVPDLELIGV